MFVAFPFLALHQPPNEAISKWSYELAPIHYGLIFFPIFVLFCIIIGKNILKVETNRKIIYPIAFCTFFAAFHMVFFIYSMIVLWAGILTIPLGIAALFGIYNLASQLDKKNEKTEEESNDDMEFAHNTYEEPEVNTDEGETEENTKKKLSKTEIVQIFLNTVVFFIIPIILVYILYQNYKYITVIKPREKARIEQDAILKCENHKKAIQLVAKKFSYYLSDPLDEITEYYKQEFEDYKFQFKPLIGNYDTVNTKKGTYYTEFSFEGKDKDKKVVYATFILTKEGECLKNSQNCRWESYPQSCIFYMAENGSLFYSNELTQ